MVSKFKALEGADLSIQQGVSAAKLTTIALGGAVDLVLEVRSVAGLRRLLQQLAQDGQRFEILGNGSNVVIDDDGVAFPVVKFGREFASYFPVDFAALELGADELIDQLNRLKLAISPTNDEILYWAFAAAPIMSLSRIASQNGWTGLEFAAGIPATLGGAIKMNAGAHGDSVASVLESVVVCDREGKLVRYSVAECEFAYRHSRFQAGEIVVGALIRMKKGAAAEIQKKRNDCLNYRRETQPLHLPSAGSVFRNPHNSTLSDGKNLSAAYLIEACGLKGSRIGGVKISDQHANWIVHDTRQGSASDVKKLISLAQNRVFEQFGIRLQPELVFWNNDQTESASVLSSAVTGDDSVDDAEYSKHETDAGSSSPQD